MSSKNIFFAIFIATSILMSCNSSKSNDGFTTIKGIFNTPYDQEVEINKIKDGKDLLISKSFIDTSKTFGFTFKTPEEGFYTLGNKYVSIPIYIKGNEVIEIDYDHNKQSQKYTLTNIPNKENQILYNWLIETDTLNYYEDFSDPNAPDYTTFFPFYKKFYPEMREFKKQVNSGNEYFDNLMKKYVDLELEKSALTFLFTPRAKHPNMDTIPKVYAQFTKSSITNDSDILKLPYGMRTLNEHQMFNSIYIDKTEDRFESLNNMAQSIKNDTIKAYYALNQIVIFKFYNDEYLNFITPLRPAIDKIPEVANKIRQYESTIKTFEPGTPGVNFTFKDINGKDVSFSDFKGKYIYIDFWATWCSPCKREIPYLKKLEEKFHGKDIVFMSVSLDKPKVHKSWKKFVKDEGLTGVQLFSTNAFDTPVAKDYKINSIPRFMLFDREGKVIDTDAKRPSNKELETQLKNLLKK